MVPDAFDHVVHELTGDPPRSIRQAQLLWSLTHRLAHGPPLNEFDLTIAHRLLHLTGLDQENPAP